jgi:hypothetical protein
MSMYQIITVRTPPVHAADAPRRTPPRPQMSMAEDAARCNAKFRSRTFNGCPANPATQNAGNAARMEATKKRDAKASRIIQKLLAHGPMSRAEIVRATGLSDDVSRRILRQMREAKLLTVGGKANAAKWSLA